MVWDRLGGHVDLAQFRMALAEEVGDQLGTDFDEATFNLFMLMDTNHDGEVDWEEFCDHVSRHIPKCTEAVC